MSCPTSSSAGRHYRLAPRLPQSCTLNLHSLHAGSSAGQDLRRRDFRVDAGPGRNDHTADGAESLRTTAYQQRRSTGAPTSTCASRGPCISSAPPSRYTSTTHLTSSRLFPLISQGTTISGSCWPLCSTAKPCVQCLYILRQPHRPRTTSTFRSAALDSLACAPAFKGSTTRHSC